MGRSIAQTFGGPWTHERFATIVNSTYLLYSFLTLLLVDFFISVLASVVRQDQAAFCVAQGYDDCDGLAAYAEAGSGFAEQVLTRSLTNFESLANGLETMSLIIAYIFVIDVAGRFAAGPRDFMSSPWDVFDALIVVGYAIALPILNGLDANESLGPILLLRVLRLLRFHRFVYAMSAGGSNSDVSR